MEIFPKRYEIFDHTADLGIRVTGGTLSDLFLNAGTALFDLIGEPDCQGKRYPIPLTVTGEDEVELLINWLRELLYLFNGKDLVVGHIEILRVRDLTLSARAYGTKVDFDTFDFKYDIKAVTYHQARVRRCKDGYEATVVFDL